MIVASPTAAGPPAAAVVLFHGGALRGGRPADLRSLVDALAARGVLAASAGYRLLSDDATIEDCLADVRAASGRFVDLATAAGVPRHRVAVGGSSAGAHLALVGVLTGAVDAGGVVALNPAGCDLGRLPAAERRALEAEVGIGAGTLTAWSPVDLVRPGLPPVLVHHGTADEVEPVADVRRFRDALRAVGGTCDLVEHDGAPHGFHHHPPAFDDVVASVAGFLLAGPGRVRP